MTLRLDADMFGWFRKLGGVYRTRIDAILRKHFERHLR